MRQKLKVTLILFVLIGSVIALAFIEAGCGTKQKKCIPNDAVIDSKWPKGSTANDNKKAECRQANGINSLSSLTECKSLSKKYQDRPSGAPSGNICYWD